MTIKKNTLEIKDLAIGYKTKKTTIEVSQNINFTLKKGELTAVVGANGIGKSTLLRTLASVQSKLSGTILLGNKELDAYKPLELATSLSLVLTEKLPTKNLTVQEVIALGRQPHTNWLGTLLPKDIEHIKKAIRLVQIEELEEKKCFELSDGQMQKVLIARALAQDTSLIILDEPTTHLDLYHKAYILKLLKEIAQETSKTILFSTHEIDLAIQLCDKILIIHKDEVVFDSPQQLIEKDSFSKLFPNDLISFDKKTGVFNVHK